MIFFLDVDDVSLQSARENITANGLDSRITLVKSDPSGSILPSDIDNGSAYDFTMCNPPFYKDREEVKISSEAKQFGPNAVSCYIWVSAFGSSLSSRFARVRT